MPRARKAKAHPLEGAGARRTAMPETISPQLATLASSPPARGEWSYEIKFDGYRVMARLQDRLPRLFTRGGHDWSERMGGVRQALAGLPVENAWLDGEVVVLESGGICDFNALQNAFDRRSTTNLTYFVFDLLYLNG
jgi:bifunctional non-homologous end joining protein LigD